MGGGSLGNALTIVLYTIVTFSIYTYSFSSNARPAGASTRVRFSGCYSSLFSRRLRSSTLATRFSVSGPSSCNLGCSRRSCALNRISSRSAGRSFSRLGRTGASLRRFSHSKLASSRGRACSALRDCFRVRLSCRNAARLRDVFTPRSKVITGLFAALSRFAFCRGSSASLCLTILGSAGHCVSRYVRFAEGRTRGNCFVTRSVTRRSVSRYRGRVGGSGSILISRFRSEVGSLNLDSSRGGAIIRAGGGCFRRCCVPTLGSTGSTLRDLGGSNGGRRNLYNCNGVNGGCCSTVIGSGADDDVAPRRLGSCLAGDFAGIKVDVDGISRSSLDGFRSCGPSFGSTSRILRFLVRGVRRSFPAPIAASCGTSCVDSSTGDSGIKTCCIRKQVSSADIGVVGVGPSFTGGNVARVCAALTRRNCPNRLCRIATSGTGGSVPGVHGVLDFVNTARN